MGRIAAVVAVALGMAGAGAVGDAGSRAGARGPPSLCGVVAGEFCLLAGGLALADAAALGHVDRLAGAVGLPGVLLADVRRPQPRGRASPGNFAARGCAGRLDRIGVGPGAFAYRIHDGLAVAHAVSLADAAADQRRFRRLRRQLSDGAGRRVRLARMLPCGGARRVAWPALAGWRGACRHACSTAIGGSPKRRRGRAQGGARPGFDRHRYEIRPHAGPAHLRRISRPVARNRGQASRPGPDRLARDDVPLSLVHVRRRLRAASPTP